MCEMVDCAITLCWSNYRDELNSLRSFPCEVAVNSHLRNVTDVIFWNPRAGRRSSRQSGSISLWLLRGVLSNVRSEYPQPSSSSLDTRKKKRMTLPVLMQPRGRHRHERQKKTKVCKKKLVFFCYRRSTLQPHRSWNHMRSRFIPFLQYFSLLCALVKHVCSVGCVEIRGD